MSRGELQLGKVGRRLLVGLTLLATLIVALLALRRPLVAHLVRDGLRDQGIEVTSLRVAEVGRGRLQLIDLRVAGGALTAAEVVAVYDLASLRAGQVRGLTVRGGVLRPALLPAAAGDGADAPGPLFVRLIRSLGRLTVRDSSVVGTTAYGELVTRLDGEFVATGPGAAAELDYAITGAAGGARGAVSAVAQADGRMQASIRVDAGSVTVPGFGVGDARGRIEIALAGTRVESAHVELDGGGLLPSDLGTNLQTAQLRFDLEAGRLAAAVTLHGPDLDLAVDASLGDVGGGSILRVDGRVAASATALARIAALPPPASGQVVATVSGGATLQPAAELAKLDATALLAAVTHRFGAEVAIDLREVSYPGKIRAVSGGLHAQVAGSLAEFELRLLDDARLTATGVDATWLRSLGLAAVAPLSRDFVARLPAASSGPLNASRCAPDGWRLTWLGDAEVVGQHPGITAGLHTRVEVEFDGSGRLARVRADDLDLHGGGVTIGGTRFDGVQIGGHLEGEGDQLVADLDLDLAVKEATAAGVLARDVTVRGPIHIARDGDEVALHLRAPASLRAAQLALPAEFQLTAPVAVEIATGHFERSCARGRCLDRHGATLAVARVALAASVAPAAGDDAARDAAAVAEPKLAIGAIQVGWTGTLGHGLRATFAADSAQLDVAGAAYAAAGITAELDLAEPTAMAAVDYRLVSLRELGKAPLLAPLANVQGSIRGDGQRFNLVGGFLVGTHGPFPTRGQFDPATGAGELTVESGALEFAPGSLTPGDLFPDLAVVRDVSGRAEASIRLVRAGGKLASGLHLRLDDIAARMEEDRVEGLATELQLDSLLPPHGPGGQVMTIRRVISTGDVSLEEAVGSYAVIPGPPVQMVFQSFTGRVAGGEMTTDDLVLSPADLDQKLLLHLSELDLGELFRQIKVEGLAGSGRLTGKLPVLVIGEEVTITDGRLDATGPGRLRYDSAAARAALGGHGQYVDLLVVALRDFHYDKLSIALDTQSGSRVQLRLELDGHNPEVMDGYPFHLNIAVAGDLSSLVAALGRGYRLREEILRKSTGR